MRLEKILEKVRGGSFIKRNSWKKRRIGMIVTEYPKTKFVMIIDGTEEHNWHLSPEDILADDWNIYL